MYGNRLKTNKIQTFKYLLMTSKFFNNPNESKKNKTDKSDKKAKTTQPKPRKNNTQIRKTGRGN